MIIYEDGQAYEVEVELYEPFPEPSEDKEASDELL